MLCESLGQNLKILRTLSLDRHPLVCHSCWIYFIGRDLTFIAQQAYYNHLAPGLILPNTKQHSSMASLTPPLSSPLHCISFWWRYPEYNVIYCIMLVIYFCLWLPHFNHDHLALNTYTNLMDILLSLNSQTMLNCKVLKSHPNISLYVRYVIINTIICTHSNSL